MPQHRARSLPSSSTIFSSTCPILPVYPRAMRPRNDGIALPADHALHEINKSASIRLIIIVILLVWLCEVGTYHHALGKVLHNTLKCKICMCFCSVFNISSGRRSRRRSAAWARHCAPQAERDQGVHAGRTSEEHNRIKALGREVHELRQANEILRQASVYFAAAKLDRRFKPCRRSSTTIVMSKRSSRSAGRPIDLACARRPQTESALQARPGTARRRTLRRNPPRLRGEFGHLRRAKSLAPDEARGHRRRLPYARSADAEHGLEGRCPRQAGEDDDQRQGHTLSA